MSNVIGLKQDLNNRVELEVTVDQVIRKVIENNNTCIKARKDENLEKENDFLKTLLPSYLTVAELKCKIESLGLQGADGKNMGQAVKYLKSNGLAFLPEDLKLALNDKS